MLDKQEVPGSNPGWPTKKRWRCEDARGARPDPRAASADADAGSRTVAAPAGDHRRPAAVSELAAPVLLRIETKTGHGAGKPTAKLIDEVTDRYAFLVKTLAM